MNTDEQRAVQKQMTCFRQWTQHYLSISKTHAIQVVTMVIKRYITDWKTAFHTGNVELLVAILKSRVRFNRVLLQKPDTTIEMLKRIDMTPPKINISVPDYGCGMLSNEKLYGKGSSNGVRYS